MIKNIIERNDNVKINHKEIAVLKEHFPSCFRADGSFDVERLSAQIKDKIDIVHEGYELNFLGKSYAKLLSSIDTTTIIQPDLEHNEKLENKNSENIYISGDNLDGLNHLLKSYSKKVKCIYIDPPYNTGGDGFVYNDKFNFTSQELEEKLSIDEKQAKRIIDMTKRGSASHSAWLMFMYPRLQLARDLLTDDGVIFISIDDNEQANLKLLCDDVFGEENFVGPLLWKNATDNNPSNISTEHEYIVCYSLNKEKLEPVWKSKLSAAKDILIEVGNDLITKYQNDKESLQKSYSEWFRSNKAFLGQLDRYKYIDNGGVYTGSQSVHNPGREGYRYDIIHPITKKTCKQPLMGYRFPESTMKELIKNDKILYGNDVDKIVELKVYAKDYEDKLSSVFELDGRLGSYDIKGLFTSNIFTNPKPVDLLIKLISFTATKDAIILDFFSGSATTAHAVMKLNAEDGGNRKYIMVQLPEGCKEGSEAQKAGYTTIDQIGIERIIRAAKKIKSETGADIDYGFKHFTLCEPRQDTLDKLEKFNPDVLIADETILDAFGRPAILTTWLVRDGYGFNARAEAIDLDGYTAYYCGKHLYFIDSNLNAKNVANLFEKYDRDGGFNPENIVLFGYSFLNWAINDMLDKNLKLLNDSEKNLKINITTRY